MTWQLCPSSQQQRHAAAVTTTVRYILPLSDTRSDDFQSEQPEDVDLGSPLWFVLHTHSLCSLHTQHTLITHSYHLTSSSTSCHPAHTQYHAYRECTSYIVPYISPRENLHRGEQPQELSVLLCVAGLGQFRFVLGCYTLYVFFISTFPTSMDNFIMYDTLTVE
jgi:hypothetical protein